MPRPSPLTRKAVEFKIVPLSGMVLHEISEALGLDALPDYPAILIACQIATHREARKLVKGHGPPKVAAGLRRIEGRMRRGHDGQKTTQEITDPHFGIDDETFTRLATLVADPDAPRDRQLVAIETRRREVEARPRINPYYALRVQLAAEALWHIWYCYAVRRDDRARQWQFVLAILEAAGEGTEGFRRNAERLRRDLGLVLERTRRP
jgi:hypothetical protein